MELSKYERYKTLDDLPVVTTVSLPEAGVQRKGVLQFIHGMCEMKERYSKVIKYFTQQGYVCVISDMRGHGENVEFEKDLGYFGDDAANTLVEDAHSVTIFIKNNYPDLPITLIGHSMGSLIVRAYAKKYDADIDMLVVVGSPSARSFRSLESRLIELITVFKDEHDVDKYINKLMVGMYDKKFESEGVANSWLCTDIKVVEEYNRNPRCGFMFTLNGHHALCKLQEMVYSKRNWEIHNRRLSVLFLAGADDPCIIDVKSFKEAVKHMRSVGYKRVASKLYKGMRHEIFNEPDYIRVCEDILEHLPDA